MSDKDLTEGRREGFKLLTLAMAGPSPFHSAPTPSAAIVFRTQSAKPEYVPVGADCILDLMTYKHGWFINHSDAHGGQGGERTSGGIAIDHIATPAMPPAKMTAPRLRSLDPAGVSMPFTIS